MNIGGRLALVFNNKAYLVWFRLHTLKGNIMTITLKDVGSGFKRTAINENFEDIESTLNSSVLLVDGSSQMGGSLDVNSNRLINLVDATTAREPVTKGQLDSASGLVTIDASTSTYTGVLSGSVSRTISSRLDDVVSLWNFAPNADGLTDDTAIIQAAIDAVGAQGGGTLLVPPAEYHCKNITMTGDNIHILGYGAKFVDISPSSGTDTVQLQDNGDSNTVEGLTFYSTHTTGEVRNLTIAGTNTQFINFNMYRLTQAPSVGTYFSDCNTVKIIGCNWHVGNMFYTEAKNVSIVASSFKGAGDDGMAIKSSTEGSLTENIMISDCKFYNYSNMVAIGTEVRTGSMVRNVTITNCTGEDVGSVLWVKPGRGDQSVYSGGIIQDVTASNCHTTMNPDTSIGPRLSSVLWIDCDNGGKAYNINMSNCSVRGRWTNQAVGSRFGLITILTNGVIAGSSIDDTDTVDGVTMINCKWIDSFDGRAIGTGSPAATGYPIDGIGNISNSATNGVIKNIKLIDCYANGSEFIGFGVGTNGLTGAEFGAVELVRPTFVNVSTNSGAGAAAQAAGIRAKTPITIRDAEIQMASTEVAISAPSASDTADVYTGEQAIYSFGTMAATDVADDVIFVAPSKCFVPMVDLISATDVPQDGTNRKVFTLSNETQASTIVGSRSTTSLDLNAGIQTPLNTAINTATGAWMEKGDTLRLQITSQGTGQVMTRLQAIIRYVGY